MADDNFTEPTASNLTITIDYVEAVATTLNAYYTPLLVLLGSIGNIISIYVFFATKLRLQSTSLYLSVLAISDTVFLLTLVPPWLNAMQWTNFFYRRFVCQIIVYCNYTTCCLSAWLVVAFTIERFVAVIYPLQRNSMCTVARARLVIFLLVAASILVNLPLIIFASPSINDCNISFDYMEHAARFNLADTLVSFSFPLTIIVILNAWIISGVYKLECERRVLQVQQAAISPELSCSRLQREVRSLPPVHLLPPMRSQHRVTRMLLIVSSVFVVLNLPAYTMRLLAYAYDMSSGEYSGRWAAVQQLTLTFFNTNFGINFILYCLSGQNFRRALCQSFPCLRQRVRRSDAMRIAHRHTTRAGSITTSFIHTVEGATEGSTSAAEEYGAAQTSARRRSSGSFIERWTFNNRRSQRPSTVDSPGEWVEMQAIGQPPTTPSSTSSMRQELSTVSGSAPLNTILSRNISAPRSDEHGE